MGGYNCGSGIKLYPEDVGCDDVLNNIYRKLEGTNSGNLNPYSLVSHRTTRTKLYPSSQPIIKEAKKEIELLRGEKELTSPEEALSRANYISRLLGGAVEGLMETERYETLTSVYELIAQAYELAAEKVPETESDKVRFPSNFWKMRATQTRLKQRCIDNYGRKY